MESVEGEEKEEEDRKKVVKSHLLYIFFLKFGCADLLGLLVKLTIMNALTG